jgi:hypothetical protein
MADDPKPVTQPAPKPPPPDPYEVLKKSISKEGNHKTR